MSTSDDELVRAAGGVVLRDGPGGEREVLIVHRPHRADWSLPKGKLDEREAPDAAAVREVLEETGWRCELVERLASVEYVDHRGRPKRVDWWSMRPAGDEAAAAPIDPAEVDEVRWVTADEAERILTYDTDRHVVRAALAVS